MAFLVSPGVHVREFDASTSTPVLGTSTGAIAGPFERGPVSSVVNISSEEELVEVFGKPQGDNFEWWFSAANFLQYSNALKVVRAESGVVNAVATGTAILIRDNDHYEASYAAGEASVGEWAARTAGTWGNSLRVSICATSTAYAQGLSSNNLVNGAGTAGATTITVDDADAVYFSGLDNCVRKVVDGNVERVAGLCQNYLNEGSDDGAAFDASFNLPRGLHFNSVGELMVMDANNSLIRVISEDFSTVSTLAGINPGYYDGTLDEAKFDYPTSILDVADGAGFLVADSVNSRIRLIVP